MPGSGFAGLLQSGAVAQRQFAKTRPLQSCSGMNTGLRSGPVAHRQFAEPGPLQSRSGTRWPGQGTPGRNRLWNLDSGKRQCQTTNAGVPGEERRCRAATVCKKRALQSCSGIRPTWRPVECICHRTTVCKNCAGTKLLRKRTCMRHRKEQHGKSGISEAGAGGSGVYQFPRENERCTGHHPGQRIGRVLCAQGEV